MEGREREGLKGGEGWRTREGEGILHDIFASLVLCLYLSLQYCNKSVVFCQLQLEGRAEALDTHTHTHKM